MGLLSKALGSASGSFKTVQSGLIDPTKKAFGVDQPVDYTLAKHGIRWKVADAKKAGIHPLYALGASPSAGGVQSGGNLIGALASAGSDISRAVQATRSQGEREDAYSEAFKQQQYERNELENDLLRAQIAKTSQVGPPLPSAMTGLAGALPGQSPEYRVQPATNTASAPGHPSQRAGAESEISWVRFPGGLQPTPNMDAFEDADIGNPAALAWYWRNFIIPNVTGKGNKPDPSLSPTGDWEWSRIKQGWIFKRPRREQEWVKNSRRQSELNRRWRYNRLGYNQGFAPRLNPRTGYGSYRP